MPRGEALAVSTMALWVLLLALMVGPQPSTSMSMYQRHQSGSRSAYDIYYRSTIQEICARRERLYVILYDCLDRPARYMCWLMYQSMASLHCQEPCYKYQDQRCVATRMAHADSTCTPVQAICEGHETCCKFPQN